MNAITRISAPIFHRTVPALARYIERIGAVEKNFRRYMVQEQLGHYYREQCLIKLGNDGTVTASDTAYAPTADEQADIKQAFERVTMPHSMQVRPTAIQDLLTLLRAEHQREAVNAEGDPLFFEFYNQRSGNLIMVQQRLDLPDGKKRYLPWCFWNDGMWRNMEPDGDLPFWKPKEASEKRKIMVHEGAKAAKHVHELCADPNAQHPWLEELRQYEHWGMIGGALSPHRADYQELFDREPDVMVYVCDNDKPGKEALVTVSKNYRRTMVGVDFDERWPPHWDMADPMPQGINKTLIDCMKSCTWATDEVPIPGSKRLAYKINRHFEQEWLHTAETAIYVHNDVPRKLLSEDAFNSTVRPFSDVKNTAELLAKSTISKAAELRYDPGSVSGKAVGARNEAFVNTYMPPEIKPLEGEVTPWLDYLAHVFPYERDRKEVIRWCATLVCRPSVKMNYGLLLISETQGVGKSTLGSDVLRPLVGEWNYSEPSAITVCESNFNGWSAHKRLAVIHEVYDDYKSKSYERLKSVITEAHIDVNEKYQKPYRIENWLHVIACSNNKRALKLGMEDRRWFVPRVAESKRSPQEWVAFHKWLAEDSGLQKIRWWFEQWLQSNEPVRRGEEAPLTTTKQEVIRDNYSPGQEMTAEFLEWLVERHDNRPMVVLDVDLQTMLSEHLHEGRPTDRLEKTGTLRKVAKVAGWFTMEQRVKLAAWRRAAVTKALTNSPDHAGMAIADLKAAVDGGGVLFVDVAAMARAWRMGTI